MQIKKYLTELWDKIKYDETGQLKIGRVSPYIHAINALRSPQKYREYMLGQAVTKQETRLTSPTTKTTPKLYNPWAGKSIEEIRTSEYERKPALKPLEAPPSPATWSATAPDTAKALAYLKEYVGQMRAAGFSDYLIREKLIKTGSIFIPDELPANFGQTGPWATGMADEFRQAAMKSGKNVQGLLEDWIPSPNEYLNYMPGSTANRLPTTMEIAGQETSPFYSPTGKFSPAKMENLSRALANYMTTYKGETAPFNQWTAGAGVAGLPTDIAQQIYQESLSIAAKNAEEAKAQEEYEEGLKGQQDIYKTEFDAVIKSAESLIDDWNKAKSDPYNEPLFAPIPYTDETGAVTEYDPLDLIIQYIREGQSIEKIAELIYSNRIPITNYQLQGLYYLYGK